MDYPNFLSTDSEKIPIEDQGRAIISQYFPENELITTGIYYYPEHWNEDQWKRDIRKIADMGFEFVHLAEFAWFPGSENSYCDGENTQGN